MTDDSILVLDTASYFNELQFRYKNLLGEIDTATVGSSESELLKNAWKDDTQAVQFRLFDRTGVELFKMVGCYVDPPMKMDWNVDNCFDTFPPETKIESLNSHNFGLDFLLSNSSRVDGSKISLDELPQSKYYGVILWLSLIHI